MNDLQLIAIMAAILLSDMANYDTDDVSYCVKKAGQIFRETLEQFRPKKS
jgi:hypothetical protein